MRYWDSSAIVPLLVEQAASERMRAHVIADAATTTWWATPVECAAAIARMEREQTMDSTDLSDARKRLRDAMAEWASVSPSEALREQAARLVRIHFLRAADALQLSAALIASDYRPRTLEFVTLDARLAAAAELEGFRLLN